MKFIRPTALSRERMNLGSGQWKKDTSDTFQVLLDSGAIYLALGAVICVMLGVAAVRRLFQGANKIKTSFAAHDMD
jgi:hypothetical protein